MHDQKVIHRDLKPDNILFDDDGNVKVCDFGFAIMQSSSSAMLKSHCGTPMYAAPEMFSCDPYIGPPVDVWSLGVILYVMLTGDLPFPAETVAELIVLIQNPVIEFPPCVSRDAMDLIRHMLVANPKRRLRMEQIRSHAWLVVNYLERPVKDTLTKHEEFVNAFELIGLLAEGRQAVTLNYSRKAVLQAINGVVELHDGHVCGGDERCELIVDCSFTEGDTVRTGIDVVPIDDKCVIVMAFRITGTDGRVGQMLFGIEQWLSMFSMSD
jgi:serine/threonine protein kinase